MKIQYVAERNLAKKTQDTIVLANSIIIEYQGAGLDLTLRQLYYQFVARGYIANKQTEYKRLGGIINDARLLGLIDWDVIQDRTRNIKMNTHWDSPAHIIRGARASYRLDHWAGQKHHVEVWIEKEALVGVIDRICTDLDVPYFACRGYVSQSEMWRAANRLQRHWHDQGQIPVILHLGDHDPSGMDMSRDIETRLVHVFGLPELSFRRIALNMDQVNKMNPPPNPAKLSDSRASEYVLKYGTESWELDAIDPKALRELITHHVLMHRDESVYNDVIEKEREHIEILKRIEDGWETI